MNRSEYTANAALANTPQYDTEMARWMKANNRAAEIRKAAKKSKSPWWKGWFAW